MQRRRSRVALGGEGGGGGGGGGGAGGGGAGGGGAGGGGEMGAAGTASDGCAAAGAAAAAAAAAPESDLALTTRIHARAGTLRLALLPDGRRWSAAPLLSLSLSAGSGKATLLQRRNAGASASSLRAVWDAEKLKPSHAFLHPFFEDVIDSLQVWDADELNATVAVGLAAEAFGLSLSLDSRP